MSERQVQRLMKQYDEEQVSLEQRIQELKESQQGTEYHGKKSDINRFVALIRRYTKIFTELTDTMLHIDRYGCSQKQPVEEQNIASSGWMYTSVLSDILNRLKK